MALEVLKDMKKIGGFPVGHWDGLANLSEITKPIHINHNYNNISFRIQNGPIREVGENGCQIDALIHTYREILIGLNKKFPCDENLKQIDLLNEVIEVSEARRLDRLTRGVEGFNKE